MLIIPVCHLSIFPKLSSLHGLLCGTRVQGERVLIVSEGANQKGKEDIMKGKASCSSCHAGRHIIILGFDRPPTSTLAHPYSLSAPSFLLPERPTCTTICYIPLPGPFLSSVTFSRAPFIDLSHQPLHPPVDPTCKAFDMTSSLPRPPGVW